LLLAIVAGSGFMGETLSAGNAAVALLGNSIATGAGLYVLITLLGPVSGAHFNPVVSLMSWKLGQLDSKKCLDIGYASSVALLRAFGLHICCSVCLFFRNQRK